MNVFFKVTDNSAEYLSQVKNAIASALEEVGKRAEAYAKERVPVDTGKLKASITHTVEDDTVFVGSSLDYALFVETGTSRMRAQPYLKPAMSGHSMEYEDIFKSALKG